jgi:hypothetical protein
MKIARAVSVYVSPGLVVLTWLTWTSGRCRSIAQWGDG